MKSESLNVMSDNRLSDASLGMHVRAQQVAVLYGRARPITYSHLIVALVTIWFLSNKVAMPWLLGWFAVLAVLSVVRLATIRRYERTKPSESQAPRWGYIFVAMSGGLGLFWALSGMAMYALLPPDPALTIFFWTLFIGYVAGAASGVASYMPAFYAFAVPMLLSLTIALLLRADELHMTLVGFVGIFLVFQITYARHANRTMVESIAVRFENLHLIRELRQKNIETEAANVAKSKFLAAASHDLRQPLHALTLFVSVLKDKIRFPEVRKIVDNISMSTQALEKLFAALLDISRLDAGVIHPRVYDFRAQELFEPLRNDYGQEAQHKGLTFACPPTELVVRSDPQLLERILRNYLSNAVRYTARGGIVLRCYEREGAVRVEVADTGRGIPRDKQEEIFREFHQLENPERDRTKGLGLGLAIVERLAKLLDHPIGVDSMPMHGSVFHVSVPIGDASAAVALNAPQPETDADLSGMLVLVIDDEASVREGMNTLLGQWGCELLLAGSEDEAVELLRRDSLIPDVVIADYRLREDKTGVQAIRRVHAECGIAVPALIIAGDTAPDRLREVATSGFPLFHKPVAPAQLRAFLQQSASPR